MLPGTPAIFASNLAAICGWLDFIGVVWTDVLKYPIQSGLLESITLRRPEHDIFQYWFEECIDDEISSIWYLTFFEKRIFVASISPRQSVVPAH